MVASRNGPKGVRVGPFGLSVLALSLMPTSIGYQDLAALLIRQQDVSQRARAHAMASPFGTIHAATFSFPRPIGSMIPEPPAYRLASLGAGDPDITGAIARGSVPEQRQTDFPVVNRRLKGDLLVARPKLDPEIERSRDLTPGRVKTVSFPRPPQNPHLLEDPAPREEEETEVEAVPVEEGDAPGTPVPTREKKPKEDQEDTEPSVAAAPGGGYALASLPPAAAELPPKSEQKFVPGEEADPIESLNPAARAARLYFGAAPVGRGIGPIERWPGEEPVLLTPHRVDPDIKQSALAPLPYRERGEQPGETIAPKGEVTGPEQRPRTPAERLGLTMKERAKAEKCMAEAVYFESRGETKRGQIAVAQVVLNRVFSGYYPGDVCGVVYQNAHRYNACQFTFACDKVKDVVNDPPLWEQAKEIARDMMEGKLWLSDIGKSTHYHAYWVHPWWVGTMRKLSRIGVHTFYRPKRWGDGAEAPTFGPGIAPDNVKLQSGA